MVSSGNQLSKSLKLFSPAYTSIHASLRRPPYAFSTAASSTRTLARQISGPVPSPSIKGIMGLSGTTRRPFCREIAVPDAGGFTVVKVVIALGHITRHVLPDLHRNCGKLCGNRIALGASARANAPFQAV